MQNDLEFIKDFNEEKFTNFKEQTKNALTITTTTTKQVFDYSWVDFIEKQLPYLDNIIRNPRRFIIPEEEVLLVEKTKRINEETVKHLAQHASLIQSIDEEGMVQPKKLLNINREETFDIYENRFIYTLIKRLYSFLEQKAQNSQYAGTCKINKKVNYTGQTKIDKEKVNINLTLEKTKSQKEYNVSKNINDINKRIYDMTVLINGFLTTNFVKGLSQVAEVTSPIRKTNLILKETNFQQAVKLWEYLDAIENYDFVKQESTTESSSDDALKNKFLVTYFLDYSNLSSKTPKKDTLDEKLKEINKLTREYALESAIDIDDFKKQITANFENIRRQEAKVGSLIYKRCDEFIKNCEVQIGKIFYSLK